MKAIEFQNVSFSYGEKPVLHDVSFSVARGTFTALLGANGAGKSTIFSLLLGLSLPNQGEIRVEGAPLSPKNLDVKRKIGAVFQQNALDNDLSVLQNLRYFGAVFGAKQTEMRIQSLLDSLELEPYAMTKIAHLSGGYKRRVEIARALLHEPKIMVVDEPTAGLDPVSKDEITAYLHALTKDGITVFWITHLLDELEDDDHVIILENGAVKTHGQFAALGGVDAIYQSYRKAKRVAL